MEMDVYSPTPPDVSTEVSDQDDAAVHEEEHVAYLRSLLALSK